jgi:hypothetical protein
MHGPIAAGGGVAAGDGTNVLQVCEGDDYTLTASSSDDASGAEALPPMAPVRHDLTVYFAEGSEAAGLYLVFLDGQPVEIGEGLAPAEPGQSCAQIDLGLLVGEPIEAGTEVHVEAATLGEAGPVVP